MIDVVVADDQDLVRDAFAVMLASYDDISVVATARDGAEAVRRVGEFRPDVVLMDVRMPIQDGISATRDIIGLDLEPQSRVIVLTTFDLDEYVYAALQAGASGFLLKDTPRDALVSGIRSVVRGEMLISPAITRRLIEQFLRRPPPSDTDHPEIARLSARERQVLLLIARGMSNAEIAAELVVSDATAKTHVAHVLAKLDVRDRVQAVIVAYECGLVSGAG